MRRLLKLLCLAKVHAKAELRKDGESVDGMNEIELLKARVIALENANQQLKALLRNAGIKCSDIDSPKEQNQGERIIPEAITQNHPRLFFSYFWGRLDVYSKRFQNKTTGKAGYFPQCDNF